MSILPILPYLLCFRHSWRACLPVLVALVFSVPSAPAAIIDFEGLPDGTILTNQYSGLTFSNTIILTAGVSLNEFEFPPHSGTNVASDNGGPISIFFSIPVVSFDGYFTYADHLNLAAFNVSDSQVASSASLFLSNLALSGDPGSSPNEFLQLNFAGGISRVTITGDPAGGSFALDDASYQSAAAVPEPSTFALMVIFLISALILKSPPNQKFLKVIHTSVSRLFL